MEPAARAAVCGFNAGVDADLHCRLSAPERKITSWHGFNSYEESPESLYKVLRNSGI